MKITFRDGNGVKITLDTEGSEFSAEGVDTLIRQAGDAFQRAVEIDRAELLEELSEAETAEPE